MSFLVTPPSLLGTLDDKASPPPFDSGGTCCCSVGVVVHEPCSRSSFSDACVSTMMLPVDPAQPNSSPPLLPLGVEALPKGNVVIVCCIGGGGGCCFIGRSKRIVSYITGVADVVSSTTWERCC